MHGHPTLPQGSVLVSGGFLKNPSLANFAVHNVLQAPTILHIPFGHLG